MCFLLVFVCLVFLSGNVRKMRRSLKEKLRGDWGQKLWQNFNIVQLNYSLADKTIVQKPWHSSLFRPWEWDKTYSRRRRIKRRRRSAGQRGRATGPRIKWVICECCAGSEILAWYGFAAEVTFIMNYGKVEREMSNFSNFHLSLTTISNCRRPSTP